MCPLYPLHFLMSYSMLCWVLWILSGTSVASASSHLLERFRLALNGSRVEKIDLTENEIKEYEFSFNAHRNTSVSHILLKETADDRLIHLDIPGKVNVEQYSNGNETITVEGKFNATGSLLGFSKLRFIASNGHDEEFKQLPTVNVEVHRGRRLMEIVFIHVVIILVTVAYINMGCALDLTVVKSTLKRPIGPAIGLATQYLIMPILSFSLGYALFRDTPEMWLGLFITGCAPGGGGSNLWTYLLNGSLDLSATMTFISTLAAFAMLPLWVFALGRIIFPGGEFSRFPYRNLIVLILGFLVACGIGVLIRHRRPRAAEFLKKMLKPVAIIFIVVVMTFGVYANLYMFSFFSWKVIIGGFCLPFFGYLFGGITALAFKQDWPAVTAISIETGVQNTGLAIGVIKIALREFSPLDDISMVMPVAVATMIPIPLTVAYIMQLFINRPKKITKQTYNFQEVNSVA